MGCVYAHILKAENSKQNGWMYIGQAEDVKRRWANKERAYKDCTFIHREMKKHGWDSFEHVILEDNIPSDKLNEREEYWIKKYHTYTEDPEYNGGFNLTPGGDGARGPRMSMRGKIPKNIPALTAMKYKPIKCVNSGSWKNKEYYKGQTWNSLDECAKYFNTTHVNISHRFNGDWSVISGPIFCNANDDIDEFEEIIKRREDALKEKQRKIGELLASSHKTGSKIDYAIKCEETGEIFNIVSDCLKKFEMSRATLNGHLIYPEKHKTAKGFHFKRIPKTNADS